MKPGLARRARRLRALAAREVDQVQLCGDGQHRPAVGVLLDAAVVDLVDGVGPGRLRVEGVGADGTCSGAPAGAMTPGKFFWALIKIKLVYTHRHWHRRRWRRRHPSS